MLKIKKTLSEENCSNQLNNIMSAFKSISPREGTDGDKTPEKSETNSSEKSFQNNFNYYDNFFKNITK